MCKETLGTAVLLALFSFMLTCEATAGPVSRCEGLAQKSYAGLSIAKAVVVKGNDSMPEYCAVTGTADPKVQFEARLPNDAWNGKFYQAGCGGFCGDFNPDAPGYSNTIVEALKRGYAVIRSNNGHAGALTDASWAVNNEEAVAVYAETGIPILYNAGHALIKAFFGKVPRRSYFAGCSNGGRMAAMAAQRYPELYDGILSGAPVLNLTTNGGLYGTWVVQKNTAPDGSKIIDSKFNVKLPKLRAEIFKQCPSAADPDKTLIADPRSCQFDASRLPLCAPGENTAECFTDDERATLNAWYAGPSNRSGRKLYSGTPVGSEAFWPVWLSGTAKSRAGGMDLANGYLKMAFSPADPGPALDAAAFNFDRDPPRLASRASAFDAVDPNLASFAKAGGKMLMYHGWADPLVLPQGTVDYFEAAVAQNGGLARTQKFFRLFMIAGVGHCWDIPADAPDQFDPIAALEQWVEHARPPTAIPIVQKAKDGTIKRRGRLMPFPQIEELEPIIAP